MKENISVIITTYNRQELFKRAIDSALNQDYSNYDIHIVDDASTDSTQQIIKSILAQNSHVFYWRHRDRKGLSAARNTGIEKSTGSWVAFLDDDDLWKEDCLTKRIQLINRLSGKQKKCLGVLYSGCEIHIPHEKRITYNMPKICGNIAKAIIKKGLCTIPSSCIFSRQALGKIGGFDEELFSFIDHDIWMSLATHNYSALCVHLPLVITCNHNKKKSMVTNTAPRIQGIEQYLEKWKPIYKKWFGNTGAEDYAMTYRANVLGSLAAQKASEGNFREFARLTQHLFKTNGYSIKPASIVVAYQIKALVRKLTPISLISLIKGR